jgi:cytochrome c-type biogenesis protein CcmH
MKRKDMGLLRWLVGWLMLFCAHLVLAQPSPNTPPPDFSPRVFEIARELRCPVCQGESAAESNAGIALEMRRIIAEQLAQGKTEAEIRQFFVDRYGDWILYKPPARGLTLWVWLSPLLGLGLLGFGLWRYLARVGAQAKAPVADVSEEEIARLEAELHSPKRQS